jgi:hypothetical protein
VREIWVDAGVFCFFLPAKACEGLFTKKRRSAPLFFFGWSNTPGVTSSSTHGTQRTSCHAVYRHGCPNGQSSAWVERHRHPESLVLTDLNVTTRLIIFPH